MKIGIIIYSGTGHTESVAMKLKEKYTIAGHEVNIEKIIPDGKVEPRVKNFPLKTKPVVDGYDALLFGSCVNAFALSSPMDSYLQQITSLKNKKTACFVIKGLPFYWTGAMQAINKMKKICESKGAIICGTGYVVWNKKRDVMVKKLEEDFGSIF